MNKLILIFAFLFSSLGLAQKNWVAPAQASFPQGLVTPTSVSCNGGTSCGGSYVPTITNDGANAECNSISIEGGSFNFQRNGNGVTITGRIACGSVTNGGNNLMFLNFSLPFQATTTGNARGSVSSTASNFDTRSHVVPFSSTEARIVTSTPASSATGFTIVVQYDIGS